VVCQMVVPIRAMRLDETDEETIQRVRNLFIERVTTMAELVGRFDCFMPDELNEDDEG
jgi:hypothetical protein